MTLILVYTLSKTILGHSFFNYILVEGILGDVYKSIQLSFSPVLILIGGQVWPSLPFVVRTLLQVPVMSIDIRYKNT